MNKKKITAESIGDFLSTAYAQHLCGLLRVEHLRDGQQEKGELYILAGQPMYAQAEKLQGQDALNYLITWRSVHFSFDPEAPRPPANLLWIRTASASAEKKRESGIEWLIAKKVHLEQQVSSLSLTHQQRVLYFLIDGQRTIADLSRCSGRSIEEIEIIIYDLQRQRLITLL